MKFSYFGNELDINLPVYTAEAESVGEFFTDYASKYGVVEAGLTFSDEPVPSTDGDWIEADGKFVAIYDDGAWIGDCDSCGKGRNCGRVCVSEIGVAQ